ncbi:hypothetical protein HUU05_04125 [candidate division KSB1 bacterium]|nr:hypothetical protein [candidate division KSB1 bacterium]
MRNLLAYVGTAALIMLMFSCSNRDDRNDVRSRYGEPDEKQALGKDIYWRELWYYNSSGLGYEFRRNAGCGSYHDTYLYATFYFPPDTSGVQPANRKRVPDPNIQQELSTEPRDRVLAPY